MKSLDTLRHPVSYIVKSIHVLYTRLPSHTGRVVVTSGSIEDFSCSPFGSWNVVIVPLEILGWSLFKLLT